MQNCSTSHLNQKKVNISKIKGLWAEYVAFNYFVKQGWELYGVREKISQVEIDLILHKKYKHYIFVEVKYLDNPWRAFERVNQKQLMRVKKAMLYFKSQHAIDFIRTTVCFVDYNKNVKMVSLD
ncbi:MAG: YraN family protein [Pseudobdellovibrio sp.]